MQPVAVDKYPGKTMVKSHLLSPVWDAAIPRTFGRTNLGASRFTRTLLDKIF